MRRRDFIAGVSGASVWSHSALAQGERTRRIGVLTGRAEDAESLGWIEAMRQRLAELGWQDGRNIRIELRAEDGVERWGIHARELVASGPDVIVVVGNPVLTAVHRQTQTIPIVFVQVGDPVGSGFVKSLGRPGGNITGFMHFEPAIGGKWLEVLKELVPTLTRVRVLLLPEVAANVGFVRAAEAAGPNYNVTVDSVGVHNVDEIRRSIVSFAGEPNSGLVVLPNPVSGTHRELIAELALSHRLPAIGAFRYMAASGGLASYGVDVPNLCRRAGDYVARILRGEKPADLPVQGPTNYEFVINAKTAKALGLTIPPLLLARADEVIE